VSNIGSLLPGTLVSALITAVVPSGLNVKLCGFYDGTIDVSHLGLGEDEIDSRFKIGKKLKARILYDTVAAGERRFALSVLPHIFNLSSPLTAAKVPLEEAVPIGKTLASVKITRVIPDWGVVARTDDGVEGFCHISHLTDERLASLSHSTVQFKAGTYHRARVIGHSPLDGVLLLSFEPKVLAQVFMAVGELEVGQVLKGTVKRLSDKALFVNVQGSVDGVVWPLHYADIRLKHPEKRFKPGSSVKARVWALEPARNRVVLTLKKSLVESELPAPKEFNDVKAGEITPAVVSKLLDKGCIVDLFGGLRAFVPQSEAAQGFVANLADIFYVGKPVNVRITDVDAEAQKLVASVRQALPTAVAAEKLEVGAAVKGVVAQIHAEQVVVSLVPSQLTALLSLANLSNHRGMGVDELRRTLKTGEKVDDLVVVSKNEKSGLLIVANKREKQEKIPSGVSAAARSFDDLQVGDVVPGRVVGKTNAGAMLRIGKHIRGRVHPCDEADDLSNAAGNGALRIDDNVLCAILGVDANARTVDLSTRKSRTNPDAKAKVVDAEITSFKDLKEGQAVRGLVRSITGAGLFVSLGRNVVARVMIKELFDDFVKDWKPRFAINQLVSGKILSVDDDKAEMTLRTKPRKAEKAGKLRISDFSEGQKVTATVKKVETYGLFLRIDNSDVSGLCHRSEIADNKKTDVSAALKGFREGDAVRAVIISVDKEKGRVNFSIKASHFADEFEGKDEDDEEEAEDDEDDKMDEDEEAGSDQEDEEDEDEGSDEEADSDAELGLMGSDDEDVVRLEEDDESDEEDEEEEVSNSQLCGTRLS
jgi:rRNA biogenesis protein RRP5